MMVPVSFYFGLPPPSSFSSPSNTSSWWRLFFVFIYDVAINLFIFTHTIFLFIISFVCFGSPTPQATREQAKLQALIAQATPVLLADRDPSRLTEVYILLIIIHFAYYCTFCLLLPVLLADCDPSRLPEVHHFPIELKISSTIIKIVCFFCCWFFCLLVFLLFWFFLFLFCMKMPVDCIFFSFSNRNVFFFEKKR